VEEAKPLDLSEQTTILNHLLGNENQGQKAFLISKWICSKEA